jgi:ATP-dependent DNA helicase DinG
MRRTDSRGVVAVLDPRIRRKGWGAAIVAALPPAPSTGGLSEVARFFGAVP